MMVYLLPTLPILISKVTMKFGPHFLLGLAFELIFTFISFLILKKVAIAAREIRILARCHISGPSGIVMRAAAHSLHKIVIFRRTFRHILVCFILIQSTFSIGLSSVSFTLILFFINDHHRIRRPVQQPLEMHGIVNLTLCIDGLVETKIVVAFLQGIESYVPVELSERVAC